MDLDANFTQETSQNFISPASAEITSIFKQAAAAAGLLITEADMSANFTQTSTQTLVHQTPAQISSQFNQTGTPNITASLEATLDANFTQTSAASLVASGVAEINANFIQTVTALTVLYLVSEKIFNQSIALFACLLTLLNPLCV